MHTDTIQISGLPESVVKAVSERAHEVGTTTEDYVRHLIEEDVASSLSMRVLYAPVREQIKESGITEEEFIGVLEEAREESHRERYGK